MTLENPFIVYGIVDDQNNNGLENATVTVSDGANSLNTTTTTDGYYYCNIQNIATDGNTINILVTYGDLTGSDSFTLSIGDYSKAVNIEITIVVTPEGDLEIYYGGLSPTEKITCYCHRWDVDNFTITIEVTLSRAETNILRNNIVPGATKELYNILNSPTYIDSTWQNNNTLKIVPIANLNKARSEKTIFVKSYGEHVLNESLLNIKIEGYVADSSI